MTSLAFTIVSSTGTINFEAYCNVTCDDRDTNHTICEYRCEISPECKNFEHIELSDEERVYIRDVHNYLRNLIASGDDTRGDNDCAKNMMVMNYHKEIELATLCMARRCELKHDQCRHTLSFDSAGQNIAHFSGNKINGKDPRFLNASIMSWYEEISETCEELLAKYPEETHGPPAHFTQLVWANTKYVGCSRVTYTENNKTNLLIVCNYSPAGNVVNSPVYEYGFGCTVAETNVNYTSLCGTIDAVIIGAPPMVPKRSSIEMPNLASKNVIDVIDIVCSVIFIYFIIYNYVRR